MNWTPQPGMKIRNTMNGKLATIVKLAHRADRDTGAMWEVNDEKVVTKEEVEMGVYEPELLGKTIIINGFAYEANLQTYWEPVVADKEKKK